MNRGRYRAINTLLFIGAALILGVATTLDPDPRGTGTHLQLGLQPCVFLSSWGIPCPACGWTTSFALMVNFKVIAAFITQPFGAILSLITIALAITSASEAMKPRDLWSLFHVRFRGRETQVASVFFVLMFAAWAYTITRKVIFLNEGP